MIIDNWTDSGRPGQMLPGWLDIAEYGDGDWEVEWEVIACPNPSGQLKWRAKQGHNSHWASVKVPPMAVVVVHILLHHNHGELFRFSQ